MRAGKNKREEGSSFWRHSSSRTVLQIVTVIFLYIVATYSGHIDGGPMFAMDIKSLLMLAGNL